MILSALVLLLAQQDHGYVQAQVPVDPPPLPSGSEMEELYRVPVYPLPPTPTQSPPPTMPYAVIDWEHQNAFVPPSKSIGMTYEEAEAGFETGWPHDKRKGTGGDTRMASGSETTPKEFEQPPLAKPRANPDMDKRLVWIDQLMKRKDSLNPYCDFCASGFNVMNEKGDSASEDDMCKLQPSAFKGPCKVVAGTLKGHSFVKAMIAKGCIDKTGEMPQIKLAKKCPGLVACNVISSESNVPMCGMRVGGWGDLLPDGTHEPTYFHDFHDVSNGFDPPPQVGAHNTPNPYCGLCVEIFNALAAKKEATATEVCQWQPWSTHDQCMMLVPLLKANADFKGIAKDGCVDFTTNAAGAQKGAGECSGLVACNAIRGQDAFPMCGGYLFSFSNQKPAAAGR